MVILNTNKKQTPSKIARLYRDGEKNIKKKRDFLSRLVLPHSSPNYPCD
jgi:hypothetical protein